MFQRRSIFVITVILITAFLITSNVWAKKRISRKETLMVCREQGPNSLDIQGVGTNRPAYGLSWNVYDRLLTYGKKRALNGDLMYDYKKLEPELAASWKIAADGKSVDFKLRKEARFHDGSSVTAQDIKWSFDRALAAGVFPVFR